MSSLVVTDASTFFTGKGRPVKVLVMMAIVALGCWLRMDQWLDQVLIDDEWHALHQIIDHGPETLFFTFGYADYSIPFGMLDASLASTVGLSEWMMRLPLLVAGIATMIVLPRYVLPRLGGTVAAVFAFLLAISPLLIFYSRIARPYALTLLLGWTAQAAARRFFLTRRPGAAVLYVGCTAFATWAHPIIAPFMLAPLPWAVLVPANGHGWAARRRALMDAVLLAIPTSIVLAALLLPPLMHDFQSLAAKSGADLPGFEAMTGVWFAWFGTASRPAVIIAAFTAALGLPTVWRALPEVRSGLFGLALIAIAIIAGRPMWSRWAEVVARYLLPVLPVLLLSLAAGCVRLATAVRDRLPNRGAVVSLLGFVPCAVLAARSPLQPLLHYPNSYTLSIAAQFDYRPGHNLVLERLGGAAESPFWRRFSTMERGRQTIAVAPFQFESYNWNGAHWESVSGQRVLPAWLIGFCRDRRYGELPREARFVPRNAVYLSDRSSLEAHHVDWIVWLRPYTLRWEGKEDRVGNDVADCETKFRTIFGAPVYEDTVLLAFRPPDVRESGR